ncbi:MAG TPA: UDP-N-acetylmuramoyl-L-alanine--D-glutamate ligase [Phycisphaerales bacterium]|nr:UDP-N-acetylmuramoyl-L-alanine--D-glutamate ligase [Phycisphaerales bacterium]
MDRSFFREKEVLVMGLGRFGGGLDSAIFACKSGARVTVTDLADRDCLGEALEALKEYDIEYHLGGHVEEDFTNSDIIIVNPAVPPANKFIDIALDAGKLVTSQIEIFFQLTTSRTIGITGSNGKSTTTALTAHLLRENIDEDRNYAAVHLAGNIGNRPLLAILDDIGENDLVVLEISSFQGEQLARIESACDIMVITNLTPNHLDRHGTFESYCNAKENLFKYQRLSDNDPAVSIFNAEDEITSQWFDRYSKQSGRRCVSFSADDVPESIAAQFKLPGRMNLSNLAAAMAVADQFKISEKSIAASVAGFEPLPNRLELVVQIDGARWYDDSISTTGDSAIAAFDAFESPIIIIAGGYDKKLSLDEFAKHIAAKAKAAVLIGQTAEAIARTVRENPGKANTSVRIVSSMAEAVGAAAALSEPGDVVLLSPACASYDMFDNYRHRSDVFTECVRQIKR